jgi:hypothetical protein
MCRRKNGQIVLRDVRGHGLSVRLAPRTKAPL